MKNRLRMLHPATLFVILTAVVVFLSWLLDIYSLSVVDPQTGEIIRVQSLLSPEGIRWWLRHVVTNFTGFAPLGMVMVTLFGLGVAEHSGFISAAVRQSLKRGMNKRFVILLVIFLGIISNVVGDAGYIILIPIAATLFQAVSMHPIAGIITAYVSVACGFSANLFLSTLDPLIARSTHEAAALAGVHFGNIGALSNYYFMFVSTFLIASVVYFITQKQLLPALGTFTDKHAKDNYKQLSRKEQRALSLSILTGGLFALVVALATFSPWGILQGITGGMTRSPFIAGAIFLLSLTFGLMGMVYGFVSGRYRSDSDIIKGLSLPMKQLSTYFVIAFFAAQMFACFEYSYLDKCLIISAAEWFMSLQLEGLSLLILFIVFVAVTNLMMVSSVGKWVFISMLFVPLFARLGIAPDVAQCAYRIGDSSTNAITPFLFYMPLVLVYMQQYNPKITYGTLLRYTWRYSLAILIAWSLLFVGWYLFGLPLGI